MIKMNTISARTTKMLLGLAALALLLGAVGATLYGRGRGQGQGQSAAHGVVTPLASANLVFDGEPACLKVARENGDPDIGASTFLLEAPSGCVVPAHYHTAEEQLLVARGDADKIKASQSERVSGHVTFGPGLEGSLVAELKRPHKLHVEIEIEGQKIVRVYDGKSAGWVVNPFTEKKDAQPMSPEDLKSVSEESDFDGPFIDYKAKGNQIELVGKEELAGKSAYRIKLTNKNGNIRFYLFDATSFLPAKWEETRVVEGKETPWES